MKTIDPTVTQVFLLAQDHILDASVWLEGGKLQAQVTVEGLHQVSKDDLLQRCQRELGSELSPEELMIFEVNRRLFLV